MCRFLFLVAAAVPGSLENNVLAVCLKCSGKGFFPTLRGLLVFKYQRELFAAKL